MLLSSEVIEFLGIVRKSKITETCLMVTSVLLRSLPKETTQNTVVFFLMSYLHDRDETWSADYLA